MTKILIAEDDNFIANAYRVKFELAGFEVVITNNGEEVLDQLKTYIPDLILLDLVMPKMDGFATLQALKANPLWQKIPILVTSNLSQSSDLSRVKELGADDYLVKSDTPISKILEKIKQYT